MERRVFIGCVLLCLLDATEEEFKSFLLGVMPFLLLLKESSENRSCNYARAAHPKPPNPLPRPHLLQYGGAVIILRWRFSVPGAAIFSFFPNLFSYLRFGIAPFLGVTEEVSRNLVYLTMQGLVRAVPPKPRNPLPQLPAMAV